MMMAKCGPLLIFLEYLFCLGAGAPAEETSAMMQIQPYVTSVNIVAFSDVHGTQDQEQGELKDISGTLADKYQAKSDLKNFLLSDSWTYIQEMTNEESTWGVVYGGDGTTAYNPFSGNFKKLNNDHCLKDHCQDSVVDDIKLLVKHISTLGRARETGVPDLKRIILAGNHDACLDPDRILLRKCDDSDAAHKRALDLINHITTTYAGTVELKNKMQDKIELFTPSKDTFGGRVKRYLCLSSSSPARPGTSSWPPLAQEPGKNWAWNNELNGAWQYVQTGNGVNGAWNTNCPQWPAEELEQCAVIQYHGAPGTPFAFFNKAFEWRSKDQNCQKALADTVDKITQKGAPMPVVLAGHTHLSDYAETHGGAKLTMTLDKEQNIGISNYNKEGSGIPNVPFGNTAVKWGPPAKKEGTKDLVARHLPEGETRGWLPPIVVNCLRRGDSSCTITRASPEAVRAKAAEVRAAAAAAAAAASK